MSEQGDGPIITFRCPPELDAVLPRPVPAFAGLPDWFKTMPQKAFSAFTGTDNLTVKKCPPFIDAMTAGFLMPLMTDLHVENGEFSWDQDWPGGAIVNYSRSPIDFHDNSQLQGSPFFAEDRFALKFNNLWAVELPAGYSLLVTHPINRIDLPFTTLTGLVDSDLYVDNFINFPALWRDFGFCGTLTKGTPVAQCIPVKRDAWTARFDVFSDDRIPRLREVTDAVTNVQGTYRRQFRAAKR
jgi:hypothetical protein